MRASGADNVPKENMPEPEYQPSQDEENFDAAADQASKKSASALGGAIKQDPIEESNEDGKKSEDGEGA